MYNKMSDKSRGLSYKVNSLKYHPDKSSKSP